MRQWRIVRDNPSARASFTPPLPLPPETTVVQFE
jgi:hypothetical protein